MFTMPQVASLEGLEDLAIEILFRISNYLRDDEVAHLCQCSSYFNKVFNGMMITRSMEDKPPRVVKIPALLWAIDYGHQHIIQRIVSQPGFRVDNMETGHALHQAAVKGDPEILSILIGTGYDVNMRDYPNRHTPLHLTAINGHLEATKMLLDHHAGVADEDISGKTAFQLATESHPHILRTLIATAVGRQDDELLLAHQVDQRVLAVVRLLAENGSEQELFRADPWGNTPLHRAVGQAVCCGKDPALRVGTAVMRYLVERGASVTARNQNGQTPIEMSVVPGTGNLTALNFFLNLGISPNTKDSNGVSLLAKAFIYHHEAFPIVEFLLKRGAIVDVDVQLLEFFYNAVHPNPALFEKLLTLILIHGADYGGYESECFTLAAHNGMLEVMKMVFEAGPDINRAVASNARLREKTPLQVAMLKRRKDMLRFLINNGVKMSEEEKAQVDKILDQGGSRSG